MPRLRGLHLLAAGRDLMLGLAVQLAPVAGPANLEHLLAAATTLLAQLDVVHVEPTTSGNLPRPPTSRIVRKPSSTAEGSGCNRALFSFSASSGAPIYGEIIAASTFLPTGSTVRSRRLQAAVNNFWHLVEKLAAAAPLLDGDAKARLARWRLRLLNVEHAAIDILHELRASGREFVVVGAVGSQPVHEAMTYLDNHRARMNYAAVRAAGLPIGSGNVEATCKTLVQVRMKRAGSRWNIDTGRHVLQLRAAVSDRWDEAIDLTLRPLRKSVRVAA